MRKTLALSVAASIIQPLQPKIVWVGALSEFPPTDLHDRCPTLFRETERDAMAGEVTLFAM